MAEPLLGHAMPQVFQIVHVNVFGGALFGCMIGNVAPVVTAWHDEWASWRKGVFAASLVVGATIMAMLAGTMAKRIGRRPAILLLSILCVIGTAIATAGAGDANMGIFTVAVIGRVIGGLAAGGACVVCPLYVTETATESQRSWIGTLFQVSVCNGILLAAGVSLLFNTVTSVRSYLLAAIPILPGLGLLFIALSLPETQAWLAERGGHAHKSLSEVTSALFGSRPSKFDGIGDHRDEVHTTIPLPRDAIICGMVLALVQQLTGINAIVNFSGNILSSLDALVSNAGFAVVNFAAVLVSIPLASKVSRRVLFLSTLAGCTIADVLMAIFGALPASTFRDVASIGSVVLFVVSFEFGLGPLFFVLATEIFPAAVRDRGCSIVQLTQFLLNVILVFAFPVCADAAKDSVGSLAPIFGFFAAVGVLGFMYLFFALRRTDVRGGSYEQI